MKIWLILILLCSIPSVYALDFQSYQVTFDVQPTGDVAEHIQLTFAPTNASTPTFFEAGSIRDVHVNAPGSLETTTTEVGGSTRVGFTIPPSVSQLEITFVTSGLVFQAGDVYQFFTNLNIPTVTNASVTVLLPKGTVLYRSTFAPSTGTAGSDGERIKVSWEVSGGETGFSVQYEPLIKGNIFILPAVGVLAIGAVVVVFLFYRKKGKTDFLLTFFEDERKVILELQEKQSVYQNTLERSQSFSRAKMTRMMQKFERMGLIKREKAGRTMRITWLGGSLKNAKKQS